MFLGYDCTWAKAGAYSHPWKRPWSGVQTWPGTQILAPVIAREQQWLLRRLRESAVRERPWGNLGLFSAWLVCPPRSRQHVV
jgi:hypothetical protein